jgi:hypothetical protein
MERIMNIFKKEVLLLQIIILILFSSCQKNDPLVFLPENAGSIGHINVKYQSVKNLKIGADYFLKRSEDSSSVLNNYLNEINKNDLEVYFSNFGKRNYCAVIICSDLGKLLKRRLQVDKELTNFNYKEIFNDRNFFLSPVDDDILLCATQMDEVRAMIKRNKDKSILKNPTFEEIYKSFENDNKEWMVALDSINISKMVSPFSMDTIVSPFMKYIGTFKYILYFKDADEKNRLTLESGALDPETLKNIENEFNTFNKTIDFQKIKLNFENYKFSEINFQNNNKTFKINIR